MNAKRFIITTFLLFNFHAAFAVPPELTTAQIIEGNERAKAAMSNIADRQGQYRAAYEILDKHRLLPARFLQLRSKTLPGPVYQKNIFHFFWGLELTEVEYLECASYISCVHPFICCSDRSHGVALYPTDHPLKVYFKKHIEILYGVLGTYPDIFFKDVPEAKQNKIPSFAEVFFLDYVIARGEGLRMKASVSDENQRKSFEEVISWTFSEPVTTKMIGESIAYKVSSSDNFTKFALSPFFKHIASVVNGSEEVKKAAKESLLSEIILGFFIDHAGDDPAILEGIDNLDEMIARYDVFGVINEMKDGKLLETSFDKFLSYLTSNTSWYTSVTGDLTQLKETLNIQF